MQVIVQSKSFPVTQALRLFVSQQALKLNRLGQRITSVTVFLDTIARKKNDGGAAEVKMCLTTPGKTMCVKRTGSDLYQAIIDTVDRTGRALRKSKERRMARRRQRESARTPGLLAIG